MKLRPLTGQVLVEVLRPKKSDGGVDIADHTLTPEEHQARAHHPTPPDPIQGIVRAIGPWKKTKGGLAMLPEFRVGDTVLMVHNAGIEMQRSVGQNYRMVLLEEILGIIG